jgi:hypothetical protein
MVKVLALAGIVALLPPAAPAQPGKSSSWGTVGGRPLIATRALSPKAAPGTSTIRRRTKPKTAPNGCANVGRVCFPSFIDKAEGVPLAIPL